MKGKTEDTYETGGVRGRGGGIHLNQQSHAASVCHSRSVAHPHPRQLTLSRHDTHVCRHPPPAAPPPRQPLCPTPRAGPLAEAFPPY